MRDPTQYMDPFFGNGTIELPEPQGIAATWFFIKAQSGNTHPGACAPFGMVSACAYTGAYPTGYGINMPNYNSTPQQYLESLQARGFAHLHQSGTGAIDTYYNYLCVTPLTGSLAQLGTRWPLEDESARPGYYATTLGGTGIRAEITASARAALHRYTFAGSTPARIAVDLSAGGIDFERMRTLPTEAEIVIQDSERAQGCVVMAGVKLYFALHVAGATSCATWVQQQEQEGQTTLSMHNIQPAQFKPFGLVFDVPANAPAHVRVAFSLKSTDQAWNNLQTVAHPFERVASETAEAWRQAGSRVQVEGGTAEQREIFYSSLYHSLCKPADWSGESPYWDQEAYYVDMATMWDQYKTQLPLILTLYPDRGRDIVNTLISLAECTGGFPNGHVLNADLNQFDNQARSLAHHVIADALYRRVEGIDWQRALCAMRADLDQVKNQPYLQEGSVRPVTHTLDLAGAHYCTAQLAKHLGQDDLYSELMSRSTGWRNVYDEKTGLLIKAKYYEGGLWNYSFRLLHDMAGRIALAGGETGFCQLLDRFFGYGQPPVTQPTDPRDREFMRRGHALNRFEGYNNEPDIETPYAYTYAGRPDRTAEVVHAGMRYMFTTGRGGLPGNNDSGGLTSCYIWNALGLFPVTGQPVVLIGSPLFESSTLHLAEKTFTVRREAQSPAQIYVQSATLNGQTIDRAYLTVDELMAGGTLALTMGDQPSAWARDQRPPSYPPDT